MSNLNKFSAVTYLEALAKDRPAFIDWWRVWVKEYGGTPAEDPQIEITPFESPNGDKAWIITGSAVRNAETDA